MTDEQDDRTAMVDGELRAAAADLDMRLMSRFPGSFEPTTNTAQPWLVAAVALVVVGLAVWTRTSTEDASEVTTVTQPSVVGVVESIPAVPGPSAPSDAINLSRLEQSAKPILRKPMQRPDLGVTITDPAFGTQMTRLTASTAGEAIVPLAASVSAWNADESLLLLYRTGVGRVAHQLHDGSTGAFLSALPIVPADIEQLYWSPVDASLLYYNDGARFLVYDVALGRASTVHTFAGCDSVDTGSAPIAPSADGQLWGFVCHGATRNQQPGGGLGRG